MTERLLETTKTKDEELYCVYCHRNKTNGKRYIGQTIQQDNPNKRFGSNGAGYRGCHLFYKAIQKYGWDNFDHFVIQGNLTKEEADELEILNIAFYNTTDQRFGYNLTFGGSKGKLSEEALKHRDFKGEKNPNFGKKTSDEVKKKISIGTSNAQKGLIWIHKDNKEVQVKPEDLEKYLNDDYVKGRYYPKTWVQKDGVTKMVNKVDCKTYLDNGWQLGRPKATEETKKKMSKSRKRRYGYVQVKS